ncbi:MAG: TonB-dependent receptor plug domain-containing protein, partial [Flavisolibacter sp.]
MRNLLRVYTLSMYLLLFSAWAYSQDQYAFTGNRTYNSKVTYTAGVPEKQTLLSVLKDLNRQKGVYFLYSDENIGNKLVSPVADVKQHIEKILDIVLDDTGLKYKKVNGNTYVIIVNGNRFKPKKDIKGAYVVSDISINHKAVDPVKGRITNNDGQPIAGVSITVKGTSRGTTTNSNGDFTIDVNRGETLVISSVGYLSQEVVVNDNNDISLNLIVDQGQIDETVVVTALGVKKQARSIGTSTTQVDGSKLTDSRATNLAASLTGQVAGVNVAGTSTGPYGSSRLVIRGNSSLNANNQPLYVIDGIPVDNSNAGSSGQWGGADYGDVLSTINPDNIETLTVLKSAAASALYGYRGGNGAILVTTKSGSRTRG